MSKADDMFKEIGYEKIQENKYIAEYRIFKNNRFQKIVFYKNIKNVLFYTSNLYLNEIKAVNEKWYELGWLNE